MWKNKEGAFSTVEKTIKKKEFGEFQWWGGNPFYAAPSKSILAYK